MILNKNHILSGEVRIIETLLNVYNGDFEIWKEEKYGSEYYHVSVEGYIGYEKVEDFIDLYRTFLEELHQYLIQNNYPKTDIDGWRTVYKKRAIEVCYESGCYWVFLDGYESTDIWDLYYYLEDVISQLESIEININC